MLSRSPRLARWHALVPAVLAVAPACLPDEYERPDRGGDASVGSGGAATGGSASASGGAATGGNAPASGGAAAGGSSSAGGVGTGGASGSGGASGNGGASGSGGTSGSGGGGTGGASSNSGGASATGGRAGTGGVSGTGGSAGTPATGGASTGGAAATGGAAGTGGIPSGAECNLRYGAAASFLLCEQTATTCRFAVVLNNSNCDALCATYDGACTDQDDNGSDRCSVTNAADTCATNRTDAICLCTRP